MKILFLDIDGVLNAHDAWPNGYCGMNAHKVARLDGIVRDTGCKIAIASAWRYMILKGAMTLEGFKYLFTIHGAAKETTESIVGHLPEDVDVDDPHDRGKLALRWLNAWSFRVTMPVALDDGDANGNDLGYEANGIPCVRPKRLVGLTPDDAKRVVELLNAR